MIPPATFALASVRDCSLAHSPLACRLDAILHALYVIAIVLAVVLVAVLIVAVRLYRLKNSDRRRVD